MPILLFVILMSLKLNAGIDIPVSNYHKLNLLKDANDYENTYYPNTLGELGEQNIQTLVFSDENYAGNISNRRRATEEKGLASYFKYACRTSPAQTVCRNGGLNLEIPAGQNVEETIKKDFAKSSIKTYLNCTYAYPKSRDCYYYDYIDFSLKPKLVSPDNDKSISRCYEDLTNIYLRYVSSKTDRQQISFYNKVIKAIRGINLGKFNIGGRATKRRIDNNETMREEAIKIEFRAVMEEPQYKKFVDNCKIRVSTKDEATGTIKDNYQDTEVKLDHNDSKIELKKDGEDYYVTLLYKNTCKKGFRADLIKSDGTIQKGLEESSLISEYLPVNVISPAAMSCTASYADVKNGIIAYSYHPAGVIKKANATTGTKEIGRVYSIGVGSHSDKLRRLVLVDSNNPTLSANVSCDHDKCYIKAFLLSDKYSYNSARSALYEQDNNPSATRYNVFIDEFSSPYIKNARLSSCSQDLKKLTCTAVESSDNSTRNVLVFDYEVTPMDTNTSTDITAQQISGTINTDTYTNDILRN